jgi:hypothetical protein
MSEIAEDRKPWNLGDVQVRCQACISAGLHQAKSVLFRPECFVQNPQLALHASQCDIIASHIRQQRDEDVTPCLLRRLRVRKRRLLIAANVSKNINFPARVESGLERVLIPRTKR